MRAVLVVGLCLVVAGVAVVGSGYLQAEQENAGSSRPVELESALLPPYAFRKWIGGLTGGKNAPEHDLKLDRFAGRGRGSSHPTEMPGYYKKELKEAKEEYNDVLEDLRDVEDRLAKNPTDEKLQEDKEEMKAKLVEAKKGWDEVQVLLSSSLAMKRPLRCAYMVAWPRAKFDGVDCSFPQGKINKMNRELVHGSQSSWCVSPSQTV
eukprot:1842502-Rhodomonas_salina.3